MKIKLGAVIPTVQYGNLQPEFEVDVESEDIEEATLKLESHIQALWDKYGEKPLAPKQGTTKRLKAFVGGEIDYDEVNHVYSWNGEKYLSGSEYAKGRQEVFDANMISGLMAKNLGKTKEEVDLAKAKILAMWELKKNISTNFGHSIHGALELHGKYLKLSNALDAHRATKEQEAKNTHLHDHPILKQAVESFYEGREGEQAEYECLIVDHKAKRAGCIDRLLITAPNTCIIQDFKTNVKDDKEYWEDQLTFYAGIMEAAGWKVLGKEIHQYNREWKKVIL